ncbi:MAG: hypothetical protein OXO50_15760, partial [Caldilineaceae bacterium]|nr:hypothetical protein [Caldilineaceae bacterium]
PVAGLKGLSPSPLDDGGVHETGTKASLPEMGEGGQMLRAEDRFGLVVSSTLSMVMADRLPLFYGPEN